MSAAIEAMFTIDPPPASIMYGMACFIPSHTPRRFTAIMRSNASSGMSTSDRFGNPEESPALLTTIVAGPSSVAVAAVYRLTSSLLDTSPENAQARPPALSISAAVSRGRALVDVDDADARPFTREKQSGGAAETRAGAGDDCGCALKFHDRVPTAHRRCRCEPNLAHVDIGRLPEGEHDRAADVLRPHGPFLRDVLGQ